MSQNDKIKKLIRYYNTNGLQPESRWTKRFVNDLKSLLEPELRCDYCILALEQQQAEIDGRDEVIKELRKENRAYKYSLQDMAVRLENNPLSKCIDNLARQKTTKHR